MIKTIFFNDYLGRTENGPSVPLMSWITRTKEMSTYMKLGQPVWLTTYIINKGRSGTYGIMKRQTKWKISKTPNFAHKPIILISDS